MAFSQSCKSTFHVLLPNLALLSQRGGVYFFTPRIQGDPCDRLDEENEGKGCHVISKAGP